MNYISIYFFILPALLFYHDRGANIDSIKINRTTLNNQGEVASNGFLNYPDGSLQSTEYFGSSQQQGLLYSDPRADNNGGGHFPYGNVVTTDQESQAQIPSAPGIYLVIEGLQDTIPLITVGLGISRMVEMISGGGPNWLDGLPQWEYVNAERELDELSVFIRRLLIERDARNAEIFSVGDFNGSLVKIYSASYSNMVISEYVESYSNGQTSESIQFGFQVVFYCSLRPDGSTESVFFDLRNGDAVFGCCCTL